MEDRQSELTAEQAYWRAKPNNAAYWSHYLRDQQEINSRAIVDAIQQYCKDVPEHARFHEMGANIGLKLHHIRKEFPSWRISANDINPHAPAKCRDAWNITTDYAVMASEEWIARQPDASIDVLLSSDHFIHIRDLAAFERHVPRVLRPGGYLVMRESSGVMDATARAYWAAQPTAWFDHNHEQVWAGLLALAHRSEQWVLRDESTGEIKRSYDIYIFANS